MKSIGIFCGSSAGEHPLYLETARLVGRTLAQLGACLWRRQSWSDGAVADSALEAGGVVIGVMPRGLVEREIAHRGLTELHVVEDMHERKTKMAALADGFLTLEEIFEQWTRSPRVPAIRFRRWSITWYGKGLCALRGDAAVRYLGRRDYRRFSRLYAAGP